MGENPHCAPYRREWTDECCSLNSCHLPQSSMPQASWVSRASCDADVLLLAPALEARASIQTDCGSQSDRSPNSGASERQRHCQRCDCARDGSPAHAVPPPPLPMPLSSIAHVYSLQRVVHVAGGNVHETQATQSTVQPILPYLLAAASVETQRKTRDRRSNKGRYCAAGASDQGEAWRIRAAGAHSRRRREPSCVRKGQSRLERGIRRCGLGDGEGR